jgi:transposase
LLHLRSCATTPVGLWLPLDERRGSRHEALGKIDTWTLEIIKRSDRARGFQLLPRRWVVERTLAWLNRNRRLARDFERTIQSATA